MAQKRTVRRFAPLGGDSADAALPQLKGIVFDMDGTLCEPQNHMFVAMRNALGIDKSVDILDHVHSLPEAEQPAAHEKIEAIERDAMRQQVPSAGLGRLLEYLDRHGVRKAICTRNFDTPVTHLLTTHVPAHIDAFYPVVTRGFRPPKPSPAGILHIAQAWGVVGQQSDTSSSAEAEKVDKEEASRAPAELPLIMVGDSIDDIIAGYDAGAVTVLLRSPGKEDLEEDPRTGLVVDRLDDLVDILERGLESRT